MSSSKTSILLIVLLIAGLAAWILFSPCPLCKVFTGRSSPPPPLRIVVMDPLSNQLACDCVGGYAQRNFEQLKVFLESKLSCSIQLVYGENLPETIKRFPGPVDLIIGKNSLVKYDAAKINLSVRPISMLTGQDGSENLTGLFVVRKDDPAQSIADLKNHKISLGPKEETEKSAAAQKALQKNSVTLRHPMHRMPSCNGGALAVVEKEADAAVISSYALPLLEGCDTIDKGSLRVIGKTAPVPFITVFATGTVTPEREKKIVTALHAVSQDQQLLKDMESKSGFIPVPSPSLTPKKIQTANSEEWTDWRGHRRKGISSCVPQTLPKKPHFLWKRKMTGLGLSGISATSQYVIVADKDQQKKNDIFRCLTADTGEQIWTLEYPAEGEMDFSNSPRAQPLIHQDRVYLLGAFGHLHCVQLQTGKVIWKKNIVKEYKAKLMTWGMTCTPLLVDNKLIVNPGAKEASLVALDADTGNVLWKTPGEQAAYSNFIVDSFGGVKQIVGYDAVSLGGWDIESGRRLWKLIPEIEGDFNVPTPIRVGDNLFVVTENNGARLYGFDQNGIIKPKPLCENLDLAHDSSSPVVINNLAFGCDYDKLVCLDVTDNLKTLWLVEKTEINDYASLIAGKNHLLILTIQGDLLLVRTDREKFTLQSQLILFGDEEVEIWSHPALMPGRLYIRTHSQVACLFLE